MSDTVTLPGYRDGVGQINDEFIDLITREKYSTTQVVFRFYLGEHHLTFQTCLEKDGDLDWGVLFFIAVPVESIHTGQPAYGDLTPR